MVAAGTASLVSRSPSTPRPAPGERLEYRQNEYVTEDGVDETELRFGDGLRGRIGPDVLQRVLGKRWSKAWRIRSLRREGNESVVILRRVSS